MTTARFSFARALTGLGLLTLPLLASTCGGSDPAPAPAPAAPVTYTVRYSVSGMGTQAYVDKPYVEVGLTPCSPVTGQTVGSCATSANLLALPTSGSGYFVANVPVTTTALNTTASQAGKSLYLWARFYSARPNPSGANTMVSVELLVDGQPIKTVILAYADAQIVANWYDWGPGTNNYDVIKYLSFTLP